MTPKQSRTDPEILEMPAQKMAVVHGRGAPDQVFPVLMPALYGSVYTLKFYLKRKMLPTFKVSGLRARYPDAHLVPREQWTHIIGLPIPPDVETMPQKVADIEVRVETWDYGTVAQILHLGSYADEGPAIERLRQFIKDSGYEITGMHEEEYMTSPKAKVQKTIVRYPVKKH